MCINLPDKCGGIVADPDETCNKPAEFWYRHNDSEMICGYCNGHNYPCGSQIPTELTAEQLAEVRAFLAGTIPVPIYHLTLFANAIYTIEQEEFRTEGLRSVLKCYSSLVAKLERAIQLLKHISDSPFWVDVEMVKKEAELLNGSLFEAVKDIHCSKCQEPIK